MSSAKARKILIDMIDGFSKKKMSIIDFDVAGKARFVDDLVDKINKNTDGFTGFAPNDTALTIKQIQESLDRIPGKTVSGTDVRALFEEIESSVLQKLKVKNKSTLTPDQMLATDEQIRNSVRSQKGLGHEGDEAKRQSAFQPNEYDISDDELSTTGRGKDSDFPKEKTQKPDPIEGAVPPQSQRSPDTREQAQQFDLNQKQRALTKELDPDTHIGYLTTAIEDKTPFNVNETFSNLRESLEHHNRFAYNGSPRISNSPRGVYEKLVDGEDISNTEFHTLQKFFAKYQHKDSAAALGTEASEDKWGKLLGAVPKLNILGKPGTSLSRSLAWNGHQGVGRSLNGGLTTALYGTALTGLSLIVPDPYTETDKDTIYDMMRVKGYYQWVNPEAGQELLQRSAEGEVLGYRDQVAVIVMKEIKKDTIQASLDADLKAVEAKYEVKQKEAERELNVEVKRGEKQQAEAVRKIAESAAAARGARIDFTGVSGEPVEDISERSLTAFSTQLGCENPSEIHSTFMEHVIDHAGPDEHINQKDLTRLWGTTALKNVYESCGVEGSAKQRELAAYIFDIK